MKKFLIGLFSVLLLIGVGLTLKPETDLDCFGNNAYAANYVVFNTNSHIYHAPWCKWADRCTVNCIKTSKQNAIMRGGRPCKVCGGG